MKVLIAGKDSYVGTHLKEWLTCRGEFYAEEIDMRGEEWRSYKFSNYDAVVYVAAIVHQNKRRAKGGDYYHVNATLAYDVAEKARYDGVPHFVYLSTMAVFGREPTILGEGEISTNTVCLPKDDYGRSKKRAEQILLELEGDAFGLAVVRPPNVYGRDCPGRYFSKLYKAVNLCPVFPDIFRNKKRSYIYIDNLCEHIRFLLLKRSRGIFHPQDEDAFSLVEMARMIREAIGKKYRGSKLLGGMLLPLALISPVRKIYGALKYTPAMSTMNGAEYRVVSTIDGIAKAVEGLRRLKT